MAKQNGVTAVPDNAEHTTPMESGALNNISDSSASNETTMISQNHAIVSQDKHDVEEETSSVVEISAGQLNHLPEKSPEEEEGEEEESERMEVDESTTTTSGSELVQDSAVVPEIQNEQLSSITRALHDDDSASSEIPVIEEVEHLHVEQHQPNAEPASVTNTTDTTDSDLVDGQENTTEIYQVSTVSMYY